MNPKKPRAKPPLPRQGHSSQVTRPGPEVPILPTPPGRPGGVDSSRRFPKVRLNGQWERFTSPKRDLIMLGTVQCGQEIGALARTPRGGYVQINGSVIRELSRSRIKAAIGRATRELSARLARDAAALADTPPRRASALAPVKKADWRLQLSFESTAGIAREGDAGLSAPDAA